MAYYASNNLAGSLGLRQGRIRLSAKGRPGSIKPLRAGYEKHPELIAMEKKGWLCILTYAEYTVLSSGAVGETPVEKTQVEETQVEETQVDAAPMLSLEEFKALSAKKMAAEIKLIDAKAKIPQKKDRMAALYETLLPEPS